MINRKTKLIFLTLFLVVFVSIDVIYAQCAMCKAVAESEQKGEGAIQMSHGLNTGILYLMSVPYLMGAAAFFYFYKLNKKNKTGELA